MDSHNHRFFWQKKTKLFSNTLHWCPPQDTVVLGLSLIYLANITFPAPFSTSCLDYTIILFSNQLSLLQPPSCSSFKATIQFLNKYNLLCTISFPNSKLAWFNQKILILPLWGDATHYDDCKSPLFPQMLSWESFWLLWSPFQEQYILKVDDSGGFASYSGGFASYGKKKLSLFQQSHSLK